MNELEASNNQSPVVAGIVDLGLIEENKEISITADQLLSRASDVDGDKLSIVELKLQKGEGILTKKTDESWIFSPIADWHGVVDFSYGVSDGQTVDINKQWLRIDGTELRDYSGGLKSLRNGDIVQAIGSDNGDGSSTVAIQRLSTSGKVLWSIDINADHAPSAGQILVGTDDTIFIVGGTKTGSSGESGKNDSDVCSCNKLRW